MELQHFCECAFFFYRLRYYRINNDVILLQVQIAFVFLYMNDYFYSTLISDIFIEKEDTITEETLVSSISTDLRGTL